MIQSFNILKMIQLYNKHKMIMIQHSIMDYLIMIDSVIQMIQMTELVIEPKPFTLVVVR